ncbi:MAG TPA: winged helix-turn-helix domain-containing protein [Terriglobales bacterium]|nr:winged helix-turn-helix domain-containing protein [Terriglobales bacterium]
MATESPKRPQIVRFGTFEADLARRELHKSGVRIKLHGQPFEVLTVLLERPGEAVSREELHQRLWSTDTFVDFDAGLNTAINRLREALNDSAENPRFIETLPRRGYRFIAPVDPKSLDQPVAEGIPAKPSLSESETVPPVPARTHAKRTKALAIGMAVLVVLLVVLSWTSVHERLLGHASPPHINSLAVLPLANLSGDPGQEFFADGMTEALITDLGKISALRVISRTSVVQYKGTKKSLPEIARELNVDGLIEGTVSRSGNHFRITANLLQASPEKHLWAESYESDVGDVLALQGEVAQAIAREVQVKLTPEEQKLLGSARPVDPQAHDDYLRGRYFCDKDAREAIEKGIKYFELAIKEAPSDPLGYAGLANCYALVSWGGDIFVGDPSAAETMPKARDAATQALRLDENLAEAHASLACVEMILNWNWAGAEREFKRAIELNPSYTPAHVWYAHFLAAMGRSEESVAEAKRAQELDPFSIFTMDFSAWTLYLDRHYDLAAEQTQRTLELAGPEIQWSHYDFGQIYDATGRHREALEEYIKAQEVFGLSPERLADLRTAYQQFGEKGYWRKTLQFCQEASKQHRKFGTASGYGFCDYVKDLYLALFHVRLGELDAAFQSLESAYTKHETELIFLNVDPQWDVVRSDPRFQNLVRRVGLQN